MTWLRVVFLSAVAMAPLALNAAEPTVSIRSDFPGGNAVVVRSVGPSVELAPDLRGGMPWFYWYFEAQASRPLRATFTFASQPMIGVRGPAVSLDQGQSWRWLGAEQVEYAPTTQPPGVKPRESFSYDFTAEHLTVRFAVTIPYLQHDLDQFLKSHAANPHLKQLPLTKTRQGTSVELLQIGELGPNVKAVVVTARHHACESLASYVLEGFMRAAMSDSPAGVAFRRRYVLYAVPLVDKDGVQAGDQGKNRSPHDHNRDYGPSPLYPEIRAIQQLAEAQQVQYALDFHCPALRGDIHEAFHFLGLGVPHVSNNLNEFIAWIREERPQQVMAPLNFLTDIAKPNAINRRINSHHFALRDGAVFAATLEVPYTQRTVELDAALARAYGESLLKAWNRTAFVTAEAADARGSDSHAHLATLRTTFTRLYRGKPAEAETLISGYLTADTPAVYRVEAHNLMTLLRLYQRRHADALRHCDAAWADPEGTLLQQHLAILHRLQIAADEPAASAERIDACLSALLQTPHVALAQQAAAFDVAGRFYREQKNYPRAIELAQRQLACAAPHEQGKILNRMATDYERLEKPAQAIATRTQAVQLLRERLSPTPQRSIFGATMTLDLFEALCGIPTATLDEQRAAAAWVLDHDIVTAAQKQQVREQLAKLEQH